MSGVKLLDALIPPRCRQQSQPIGHHYIDRISRNLKESRNGAARVEAVALPFFLGCSVIQQTLFTFTAFLNTCVRNVHEDESFSQEFLELAGVCTALGLSIILWVPLIAFPSLAINIDRKREDSSKVLDKREFYFKMFPVISPENKRLVEEKLQLPEMEGIQLKTAKEGLNPTWGTSGRFEFGKTTCEKVSVENPNAFLNPKGTLELIIDCAKVGKKRVKYFLSQHHLVDRLVLENVDLSILDSLDRSNSTLASIHTLVLRGNSKESLNLRSILQLAKDFPKIACFDLRGWALDRDPKVLEEEHIVLWTDYGFRKTRVKFRDGEEVNNVESQFNDLNQKLFSLVNKEKVDPSNILEISGDFPDPTENKLYHCAAPFVTKLSFLRGTTVRSSHLKPLMPKIASSFRSLRVLDLEHCYLLDMRTLTYLLSLPVEKIFLNHCDAIFAERIPDKDAPKYKKDPDYLHINRRFYLLDLELAGRLILDLFMNGTEFISVKNSQLSKMNNPCFEEDPKSYEDYAIEAFEDTLFRHMERLCQPPHNRKMKIRFTNERFSG